MDDNRVSGRDRVELTLRFKENSIPSQKLLLSFFIIKLDDGEQLNLRPNGRISSVMGSVAEAEAKNPLAKHAKMAK